ncbi:MAG TPA: ABC transporter permease subunit [Actinomycetota bacterium]|nr:ABC transporter permease subunit [Actinomycetota bacterium]
MRAADATASRAPTRAGWKVVARKEFGDHANSLRLVIIATLLGLSAIAAVFSAAPAIRDIGEQTSEFQGLTGLIFGAPGLFLRLFTITDEASRLPPFSSMVALLGPLLGIAFGFDAINGERAQGTLPRLLSQPIYRDDVINGKFAAGLAANFPLITSSR